jgi:hypothetical protein
MAGSSCGQEQPKRSTLLIGDDQSGRSANEPVNSIWSDDALRLASGAIEPPMFYVIELWIENRLMVEIAPQDMIGAYTGLFQVPVLDAHLATRA